VAFNSGIATVVDAVEVAVEDAVLVAIAGAIKAA